MSKPPLGLAYSLAAEKSEPKTLARGKRGLTSKPEVDLI